MMAMHPALRNPEVIYTISSYTEHGSIPALASTCRAFERPALNVLWRDLQSVEPLIRCLISEDLFDTVQYDHDDFKEHMVLQKPLDDKMWDTLCKYTSRVHSITQSGNSMFIESLCLLMLSCPSASAASKLFPNLVKLTWNADGTKDAAEFLRMAFVPSLVIFNMHISSASSAFLAVLSSLGTSCPSLQVLNSRIPRTTDSSHKTSPFITQSISQLHHLQSLTVCDLGIQGIQQVMQLRALHFLSLDFRKSSAWDMKTHLDPPGFRDLHHLDLSFDTPEHASNFLSSLPVVRSKKIKIGFTPRAARSSTSEFNTVSQFFATIQEKCDNDKLESFTLYGFSGKLHASPDVFTPLHACRNLTRLLIDRGCDISIAWPKLEVLSISRYVDIDDIAVPTFHGLISLLRLCPALTSLALVIDTTKQKRIDLTHPGNGSRHENLETLVLGNSPIKSPRNVALILSGLFPRLEGVNLECWDTISMDSLPRKKSEMRQWESVNTFLGGFSIVKERCKGA
ncbi:uncharacterized protein EDB91DRAFT_1105686 [Suillus paluster]|uniref:uncharacterized protein n=1 Tax=Suillus paluster TaxID=48578 RepID=UPI001B86E638|nr:uncharacterized protein EDB91DRAFT_1105686 [Suillus paluster]KAG1751463.1 hypothetical protein EDB91DRAFT_1105686 [Suillus paluster]